MNKNQKFFDILPPQKSKPESPRLPVLFNSPVREEKKKEIKSGSSFFLKALFLVVVLAAAFVLASQFVFNKTEIQLWPKTETVESQEELTASTIKASVDVPNSTIPGKSLEEEVVISQDFAASGKTTEGGKAVGKVRIYNNYSDMAQTLISGTRLISADGKLFRTSERIVVPGASYEKGKLQASSADVNVVADQPGESYNIGPTTFSIPGFVGTPKYTAFYGKSFEDMRGGFVGEAAIISEADIENAKKDLIDKAQQEGKNLLKQKNSDFTMYEDMISSEIIDSTSSFPVGTKAENFSYQVKLRMKTVGFRQADLEKFSKESIIAKSQAGKEIQDNSLKIDGRGISVDQKNGRLVLSVKLSAKIYTGINEKQLIEALKGKPLSEVQKIILAGPDIARVQIKSWPFWAAQVAEDPNKVGIKLILD